MVKVGVIGAGSMGGHMAMLFIERGDEVLLFDTETKELDKARERAKEDHRVDETKLTICDSLEGMAKQMPSGERVFLFSLPHGQVVDSVIDQLENVVDPGDLLLDCGNEWWVDTERRQKRCESKDFGRGPVHYLGCGVSGGWQSARHGPSMSPGGTREAYDKAAPLLKKWAAQYKGQPCVEYIGKRGAGHQVKCLHNGIEQGMLSVICEAYGLLDHVLKLSHEEIKGIFAEWESEKGLLHGCYLIGIGERILSFKEGDGLKNSKGVVDDIEDKVTQDVDNSEGTGVWSQREWANRHVAGPTLATAHCLRIASSNKRERLQTARFMSLPTASHAQIDRDSFVKKLEKAVYGSCLACYIQGLNVIARASLDEGWDVDLSNVIKIWRAGCIIQAHSITDKLLPVYERDYKLDNLLLDEGVCKDLASTYTDLKDVVGTAISVDAVVPALSASLEYIKMVGLPNLPTNFEETELDLFGTHAYDVKAEKQYEPTKGKHSTVWMPA